MEGMDVKLGLYTNPVILQEKLESSVGKSNEGIAVIFSLNGKSINASVNNFSIYDLVQTGCIAKSLTATLVAIAQYENKLQLEDSVFYYFDDFSIQQQVLEHLSTTKIYHLLTHTHGIDHSLLEDISSDGCGFIDVSTMFGMMNETSLIAPPGTLHLYSNIGHWFVGAILECVYGLTYQEILNEKLFAPLGISNSDGYKICPSVGEDLHLSAQDMMKIVNLHLYGSQKFPELLDYLVSLRTNHAVSGLRWPPIDAKIYPGWIDFSGSYGQLGFGEKGAGVVRFLPGHNAAMVVTSTHQKLANFILASLFKEVLPDFNYIYQPQLLNAEQWANIDSSVYQGTFDNGKYRLLVDTAVNGSLRAKVYLKKQGPCNVTKDPYINRYYQPAADHTFISLQPDQFVCPVMYFSHPQENGLFKYVNTGKFIFSRL